MTRLRGFVASRLKSANPTAQNAKARHSAAQSEEDRSGERLCSFLRSVYGPTMAFELVIHSPDGDIVLGSYHTKTAAEKMAAITIPRWLVT